MCEDYRAGATVDVEHDTADRGSGRRIECPVLVLWAARGGLPRFYPDVLDVWRPWAADVRGAGIDARHFLAEERPRGDRRPPPDLPRVMSALVRDHCLAPERVDAPLYGGRYRSLFEDLPPLRVDEDALHALGRPGGPCDLGTEPDEDTDAEIAAVWPFFGQFIAHDITADRSPLVHRADPARIRNFRVPRANLEGVYGAGPVGAPYLYAQGRSRRSCCSRTGSDVPRNHEGIALIGDPRNDVAPVHEPDAGGLHRAAQPAGRPAARRRRRRARTSSTRRGGPPPGTTST